MSEPSGRTSFSQFGEDLIVLHLLSGVVGCYFMMSWDRLTQL